MSDSLIPRGPRVLLYAERTRRRTLQVVADVAVVVWTVLVVTAALAVRGAVLALQGPAQGVADAGARVRGVFDDAAGVAGGVPFVGDRLAGAFGGGTRAGQSLADAGTEQVATVASVATGAAWLVVVVAAVPVVLVWLVLRVRWILRTRQALVARDGSAGTDVDLLALRALTTGSPRRLRRAAVSAPDGAAGAWRRGDPAVLARLADLELARLGLRGPTTVTVVTHTDPT